MASLAVPLTQGYVAIIDDDDACEVLKHRWHLSRSGGNRLYASRSGERLHRFLWRIWGMPAAEDIDHINGDGLDNRRSNLRGVGHADNLINRGPQKNNKSGYKGVHLHACGKWAAQFRHRHLGLFDDPAEAHAAYLQAGGIVCGAVQHAVSP